MVLRRAGAAGLAGASFAGRGAGRGRGLTGACDGAGRGAGGAALRVLAVRGERFYCLGEPRRKTWGRMRRARALSDARRRTARGRRRLRRVGGGSVGANPGLEAASASTRWV